MLIDVISGRSAPKERLEALKWAGRAFSFAPLWTNLNVLTATTIVLTGVSYPMLLAVTLPFVLLGLGGTLLFAQRAGGEVEEIPQAPLDRGCRRSPLPRRAGHCRRPGKPDLSRAAAYGGHRCDGRDDRTRSPRSRRYSPAGRRPGHVSGKRRGSLTASHSEFALFGAAGILVLSLKALGALAPLGALLSAFRRSWSPLR